MYGTIEASLEDDGAAAPAGATGPGVDVGRERRGGDLGARRLARVATLPSRSGRPGSRRSIHATASVTAGPAGAWAVASPRKRHADDHPQGAQRAHDEPLAGDMGAPSVATARRFAQPRDVAYRPRRARRYTGTCSTTSSASA